MAYTIYAHEANAIEPDTSTVVELHNGLTVTFKPEDPYGFLRPIMSDGSEPEEFSGIFTSMSEAEAAVSRFKAKQIRTTPKIGK